MSQEVIRHSRRAMMRRTWQALAIAGLGTTQAGFAGGDGIGRALVCVYLFGGNDSNNMLIPLSQYNSYARARGALAAPQGSLIRVKANSSQEDFGLHPAMAELEPIFNAQQLALISNVGVFSESNARAIPQQVQQHLDPMLSYAPGGYAFPSWADSLSQASELEARGLITGFESLYTPADRNTSMALLTPGVRGSTALRTRLIESARKPSGFSTEFPDTGLGQQLRQVAGLLKSAPSLGISRPIFFCTMGGFSTDSDQPARQEQLYRDLATALAKFHQATKEMGVSQKVTTYTESEFGRTLAPNKTNGSDPAWGAHHLVLGGSVLGGNVHGHFPAQQLGGPDDAGTNGTWVPTISKDQYSATLANWYGMRHGDMARHFPDLIRRGHQPLSFMAG